MKHLFFVALSALLIAIPSSVRAQQTEADETSAQQEQTGKKQKKTKKDRKTPRSFDELWTEFLYRPSVGDPEIEAFVVSIGGMAKSFKEMSDEYVNIKIEVMECEDEGDGVTTAVKITDAQGNPRTKESVIQSNLNTIGNCTMLAATVVSTAVAGTDLVNSVIANPARAFSLAFAIRQLRLSIALLGAMGREIPVFVENVKIQNQTLRQAKEI